MESVQRIENDGGRAGAGESRSDLATDVPRLANAEHDHFAARFEAILDQRDRPRKFSSSQFSQALEFKPVQTRRAFSR
jgi:hypothetical protein